MPDRNNDVSLDLELRVIAAAVEALEQVDETVQNRVLSYLIDRYRRGR